ncbi:MAG: hypothetical protein IJ774_12140 [Selenomonadaceae bacterium]|nr:hypothetical protein [Selenomonadaceae bacterium]
MRKQLRLSGSGGQGGNVTLHPIGVVRDVSDNRNSSLRSNESQTIGGVTQ